MADLSDVESAFVALLAGVAYPNGTARPSITTRVIKVYRGWPIQTELQADLAAGTSCVSVYARPRAGRNTTRYPQAWKQAAPGTTTITGTISGFTVTFGGTGAAGQNVGVAVAGIGYVVPVQGADTPTTVATGLAAIIPGASSSGPVLTCPAAPNVVIQPTVPAIRETRRQEQQVQVTIWSPTPADRDTIAAALDVAMSAIDFMALPDQLARVRYHDTGSSDAAENATLYRRDLTYLVEYATTQSADQPTVVFPGGVLQNQSVLLGTYGTTYDAWNPDEEPVA